MSAYIVNKAHIATLAFYALGGSHRISNRWGTMVDVANILAAANTESVNYRYKETAPPDTFTEREVVKLARFDLIREPVAILKAVQGLTYQSCEHPTWTGSDAHTILSHIRNSAIRELPGYDDSEGWNIEERA